MATAQHALVIVTAGLAGAKAAEALRSERFDGRIVLFGEESDRPAVTVALTARPTCPAGLLVRWGVRRR